MTPKYALRGPDREHGAHRLQHVAGREARERILHRLDQVAHRQQGLDLRFVQEPEVLGHWVRDQGSGIRDQGSGIRS